MTLIYMFCCSILQEQKGQIVHGWYKLIFKQVYTNDAEYKFKDQTPEKKDVWVKKIKEQVEAIKGSINEEDLKVVDKGRN